MLVVDDTSSLARQNSYTAELSVFAAYDDALMWQPLCLNRRLMPNPFAEDGGQAFVQLKTQPNRHRPADLALDTKPYRLRLILVQPATCWNSFGISDLRFHRAAPPLSKQPLIQTQSLLEAVKAVKARIQMNTA